MAEGTGRGKGIKSLDVVLEEVRIERAAQLQHFDALDAKAGVVLGFSGAVVALAPAHHLIVGIGRLAAVIAAISALWTFMPRRFELTDVRSLRTKYLEAEPGFTKLTLMDTQISMMEATKRLLRKKAARLNFAMAFLALGVMLVAVGMPIR
jgi:hypothetical protein